MQISEPLDGTFEFRFSDANIAEKQVFTKCVEALQKMIPESDRDYTSTTGLWTINEKWYNSARRILVNAFGEPEALHGT